MLKIFLLGGFLRVPLFLVRPKFWYRYGGFVGKFFRFIYGQYPKGGLIRKRNKRQFNIRKATWPFLDWIVFYIFANVRVVQLIARERKTHNKWKWRRRRWYRQEERIKVNEFFMLMYVKVFFRFLGILRIALKFSDLQLIKLKLLRKRKLCNKKRLVKAKKSSFILGWYKFKKPLSFFLWRRSDFDIFFSRRVVKGWFWYFWRLNNVWQDKMFFYYGPGFNAQRYNFFFYSLCFVSRSMSFVNYKRLYLRTFFELEFISFSRWKLYRGLKLSNLKAILKVLKKVMVKNCLFLAFFDRRFDFIRKSLKRIFYQRKWLKDKRFDLNKKIVNKSFIKRFDSNKKIVNKSFIKRFDLNKKIVNKSFINKKWLKNKKGSYNSNKGKKNYASFRFISKGSIVRAK